MTVIVDQNGPVTLIGGGEASVEDVHAAISLASYVVAADGGAALALEAGVLPEVVIGDFDSLPSAVAAALPKAVLHRIEDQDNTDFDKALRAISAPVVIAVGFTGGRIDHQLAAFHVIASHPAGKCIIVGPHEVVFHCPAQISLPTQAGDVVSLFPMCPVQGRSEGLEWAIDGLAFDPMTFVGTSNRALGPATLWMEGAGMLAILPRRLLPELVERLAMI